MKYKNDPLVELIYSIFNKTIGLPKDNGILHNSKGSYFKNLKILIQPTFPNYVFLKSVSQTWHHHVFPLGKVALNDVLTCFSYKP